MQLPLEPAAARRLSSLVGLGASVAAAYVHYHLLYDPPYTSFCDISATVSCTQVYSSRFSTVRGIPVAVFGAIWFAARAAARWRAAQSGRAACARACPAICSRCRRSALAVVLYLGYASFFVLKTVCPSVPDHVCRRDRAVPRVRRGHVTFP